jgi:Skp family chaperone for outer membrane proteins
MKTLLRSTLLLIALAGAAPALAETLPPPRIAVVDLDALSRKSLVTHDLEKKVNAAKETFRQTSKYRFEGLQDELRQLRIDAANMSEEERTQRQNSLEERITQAAEEQKQGLDAIDARGQAAMDSLQVKLQAIVKRVAEGMTLDIVMDKKAYDELVAGKLATPGANDITGLVATFLNAEVPTVELPAQGAKP